MKLIDVYKYLDFCMPVNIQHKYTKETVYSGTLCYFPVMLAELEVSFISFDTNENRWIIYYEEGEE